MAQSSQSSSQLHLGQTRASALKIICSDRTPQVKLMKSLPLLYFRISFIKSPDAVKKMKKHSNLMIITFC